MTTSKKKAKRQPKITAEQFDRAFEQGEDITEFLDLQSATVRSPLKRINLDLPIYVLQQIDNEAHRIGVPRTAVIKLWLYEKVSHSKAS